MSLAVSRWQPWVRDKLLFGNEPTSELFAIVTVYFVQGILGLAQLAIAFFLKDDLALSPAQASFLIGFGLLPWSIKPLYGFLSDSVPIGGYRRRPYLVVAGIMGAIAWLSLATWADTLPTVMLAFVLGSASIAISDVIIDSIVVARAQTESQAQIGSLQSLCWATMAIGGIITSYLSGWLLEWLTPRAVFAIVATFPLAIAAASRLVREEPISQERSQAGTRVRQQMGQLWQAIRQRSILLPIAFIVIWQMMPTSGQAMFYFYTNELGFQPEFLGRVSLVASTASLVGVWIFQRFLKTIPLRTLFGWVVMLSALLGSSILLLVTHANRAIGIDDYWFSLGDSAILAAIGKIAIMPFLVLAARLCPPGVEATLFALVMSAYNFSHFVAQEAGALLTNWLGVTETNFDRLWLLVAIANASTLLPLLLLGWVPDAESSSSESAQEESDRAVPAEVASNT